MKPSAVAFPRRCLCNGIVCCHQSHMMEHTADVVPASLTTVTVVMVDLWHARTHMWQTTRPGRHALRRSWHPGSARTLCGSILTWWCLLCLGGIPSVDLRHAADSPAPEARVLVAIPPAVDSTLDQPALLTQIGIQGSKRPADAVAFSLVVEAVAFVLILAATCARVHAIRSFEFLTQIVDVYRLNVAADRVLHLHTVTRVFERNPLHPVVVLTNNQRCRRRDRTGRCTWVRVVKRVSKPTILTWIRWCRRGSARLLYRRSLLRLLWRLLWLLGCLLVMMLRWMLLLLRWLLR